MKAHRAATLTLLVSMIVATAPPLAAQAWEGPAAVGLRVTDEDGQPIADARVVARVSDAEDLGPTAVTTDAGGRVVVSGLREGEWFIEVSHPAYMLYAAYIELRAGKKPIVGFSSQVNTATSWKPMTVKFQKASADFTRGRSTRRAEPKPPQVVRSEPARPAPEPPRVVRPEPEPPEVVRPEPQAAPVSEPVVAEAAEGASAEETPASAEREGDAIPAEPASVSEEPAAEVPAEAAQAEETAEPALPEETAMEPMSDEPAAGAPDVEQIADEPAAEATDAESPADTEPREATVATLPPAEAPQGEKAPTREALVEPSAATPAELPGKAVEEIAAPTQDAAPVVESPESAPEAAPAPTVALPEPESVAAPATEVRAATVAEPRPTEPTVPAPAERAATPPVAAAPDPDPAMPSRLPRFLRSAAAGTCAECEPGEWAVSAEHEAARAEDSTLRSDCDADYLQRAADAAHALADASGPRLTDYTGPVLTALFRLQDSAARAEIEDLLGSVTDPASNCQMAGVVLPGSASFSGYVLEAWDALGGRACRAKFDCAVGRARWLDEPTVVAGSERTVVYGVFKNRSTRRERRLRMTIYFQSEDASWRPRSR